MERSFLEIEIPDKVKKEDSQKEFEIKEKVSHNELKEAPFYS